MSEKLIYRNYKGLLPSEMNRIVHHYSHECLEMAGGHFINCLSSLLAPNRFVLFLAPPAWGKTSGLLELFANGNFHLVYVSPLRALAWEFYQRASVNHQAIYIGKEPVEIDHSSPCLYVGTAEKMKLELLERLQISGRECLVVFDEIHLFFKWGKSFRPKLWECLLDTAASGVGCLGMTATWGPDYHEEWKRDFPLSFNELVLLDLGNFDFHYRPQVVWNYGIIGSYVFDRFLFRLLDFKSGKTSLIFCRKRSEVKYLRLKLKKKGLNVLGCVGGETEQFYENLQAPGQVDVIVATSALSHGVNLPPVHQVFITYREDETDMWLQMAARGGRSGDGFEMHVLNIPQVLQFSRAFLYAKTMARVIFLAIEKYLFGDNHFSCKQKLKD